RGGPHGIHDLLVARAPAQVARERLPDLRVGRVRVALQQVVGGDDQAGRAEAALHGPALQEGLLDGVQVLAGAEPFDGGDLPVDRLPRRDQARARRSAVEVDGAGAALALLAGVLR